MSRRVVQPPNGRTWQLPAAVLVTLAFVLPIYLAVSNAFKSQEQILTNPLGLPAPFTLDNVIAALQNALL